MVLSRFSPAFSSTAITSLMGFWSKPFSHISRGFHLLFPLPQLPLLSQLCLLSLRPSADQQSKLFTLSVIQFTRFLATAALHPLHLTACLTICITILLLQLTVYLRFYSSVFPRTFIQTSPGFLFNEGSVAEYILRNIIIANIVLLQILRTYLLYRLCYTYSYHSSSLFCLFTDISPR